MTARIVAVWFVRRSGHQMLLKLVDERPPDGVKETVPPQAPTAACKPGPPEALT